MGLLIAGVALFTLLHLFPSALAAQRRKLIDAIGANPYRGVYSLIALAAIVMIVFGWKAAVPRAVYVPPLPAGAITSLLILIGTVLFFASQAKTNIKRILRHPQLTGTIIWAGTHLLANGDNRSLTLFGGFGLWAIIAILLINRRDGAWQKPEPVAVKYDIVTVAIGAVAFAVLSYLHEPLFGVAPVSR